MKEARIALQGSSSPQNTNVSWNFLAGSHGTVANLLDTSGQGTGWTLESSGSSFQTTTAGSWPLNEPASLWIDEEDIAKEAWFGQNSTINFAFSGLDPEKLYTLELFGGRQSSVGTTRILEISADEFNSSVTLDILGNNNETAIITDVAPSSEGIVFLETRPFEGDTNQFRNAIRIIEQESADPTPGIRLADIQDVAGDPVTDASTYRYAVRLSDQDEATVVKGTDGEIASGVLELAVPSLEVTAEVLGDTDGSGDLSGTLENVIIDAGSVTITIGAETITDDGEGVLTGDDAATGTINYNTGAYTITGAAATTAATADYSWRPEDWFLTLTDAAGERVAGGWISDSADISGTASTVREPA